jgi:hypothetical protein
MQSAEHPNLRFVQPRAFSRGRDGKAVRYLVVHYTAGSERSTSAEDGAAHDQRRTDQVSTHYFVDSNSVVQCVLTTDRANAAFHKANRLGIQYELCGTVQTRAQWLDGASDATLTNAARQMARDCIRHGIPVRRLSVAETRAAWHNFPNGPRGIVGHVDVTLAYPEDGGDHTDPGREFPWDVLLARVQHFVDLERNPHSQEEDDMPKFARWTGSNAVFICYSDGTARWVRTPPELTALQALWGGNVTALADAAAIGFIRGTIPPDWPTGELMPNHATAGAMPANL